MYCPREPAPLQASASPTSPSSRAPFSPARPLASQPRNGTQRRPAGRPARQAETLTDLCLAFGEAFPRERIIAALTASGHDATGAAQLLLDEDFKARQRREAVAAGTGPRRAESGGGGGRRRRNRRFPGGRAAAQLDRKQLLGATCGGDRKAGVHGEEEGESGEEQEEEEEGDEGLSSEEYRALANEAAEEMKAWFQKAAEAYTKGGR